jgi:hypothetical protein
MSYRSMLHHTDQPVMLEMNRISPLQLVDPISPRIRRGRMMLRHPIFLACLAAALAMVSYMIFIRGWCSIRSDGWGYYLPLPATFVYHDLGLSFLNDPELPYDVAKYRFPDGTWQGLSSSGTGYLDKYALGTAVLQLPFFLVAMIFAKLTQSSVNGFELPFHLANNFSGAFYFALGCYLAYRAARLRYSPVASGLAVAFSFLATNLLYYASFEGSFSHVYGFCLIAGLVYLTVRRIELGGAPPLLEFGVFGLIAGAAVMVRPTDAVAALLYIPFVRHAHARQIAVGTMLAFVASVMAVFPQMLHWLMTTGNLIYYSYRGEGFKFLEPNIVSYLFSATKGIFFWHPAYLVMMLALVAQLRVRFFETLIMVLIVSLNIYLGASWGDPLFGASFGCRQVIEMNALLILPTAAAIERIPSGMWRWVAASLAVLLVVGNATQLQGYVVGALPHNHATIDQYITFWTNRLGYR